MFVIAKAKLLKMLFLSSCIKSVVIKPGLYISIWLLI